MSRRTTASSPVVRASPREDLVGSLVEDLSQLFDLSTSIGDRTVGEAVEDRLRELRPGEPPEWGTEGDLAQVAKLEAGPLDFYYRPHLFPDMDPALRLGHQLQFDLLPRRLSARSPLRIVALLESYCHLSGDLIGWRMEGDELFLWIVDVSGHGIRAGLAAAVLYFLVDSIEPGHEPATFAQLMHERLLGARNPSDARALFATAFWLRFGADGRGVYASAGHPPMLLRRASGEIEQLPATGMPTGLVPEQTFGQEGFRLEPGDRACLYTDGVIEAADPEGEELGRRRLAEAVRQPSGSALAAAHRIYQAVREHRITRLPDDDLTFVVAERRPRSDRL